MSMPDFLAYREGITDFDSLAAYETSTFSVGTGGSLRQFRGALVTREFFSMLNVKLPGRLRQNEVSVGRSASPMR
jgi:hypothetical protein